jgi:hypothetical protein
MAAGKHDGQLCSEYSISNGFAAGLTIRAFQETCFDRFTLAMQSVTRKRPLPIRKAS